MLDQRPPRRRSLTGIALFLTALGVLVLGRAGILDPVKSLLLAAITPIQSLVARQYGVLSAAAAGGDDPEALKARNAELEMRVANLEAELVDYEEMKAENRILSALLNYAREAPEDRYVTADVVGRDESPFLQFIIINKGSNDGLAADMPVVTERGLIGLVTEVTANAAKVLLITDPTSAVNARIQRTREAGVVVSTLTGDLRMTYLSLDADVQPGDLVITSGWGGTFPPDLLVGEVVSVRRRTQDVFQEADVRPLNEFSALEIVLVLTNFEPINIAPILGTPAP